MKIANEEQLKNSFKMGQKAGEALNSYDSYDNEEFLKLSKAFAVAKSNFKNKYVMQLAFDNGFMEARKPHLQKILEEDYKF